MSNFRWLKAKDTRQTEQPGSSKRKAVYRLLPVACCLLFVAACRQDMQDQPKYIAYRSSSFFRDGLSARPLVDGTVPRGWLRADTQFYTGKINRAGTAPPPGAPNNQGDKGPRISGQSSGGANVQSAGAASQADVDTFPFPVTLEVVNRGQERYQIFCSMCHGMTGYGDGMVVRRGYRKPPSYHTDQLRNAPVGHFFDVITNGWGAMPNYAAQIPAQDRWAIIAYIRALQLSEQGAPAQAGPEGAPPNPTDTKNSNSRAGGPK